MNTRNATATRTGRTNTTTKVADVYTIKTDWFAGSFYIVRNGNVLVNKSGWTRYFSSRNGARKRISRERRGDFHN